MPRILLSLTSREGNPLGHLVRAVQMLHSYGKEVHLLAASDVWEEVIPDQPLGMGVVLAAETGNSADGVRRICREVEWALGARGPQPGAPGSRQGEGQAGPERPAVLTCALLAYGGSPVAAERDLPPAVLAALREPQAPDGAEREAGGHRVRQVLPARQFMAICRMGQRDGDGSGLMGERPGGVGAPP